MDQAAVSAIATSFAKRARNILVTPKTEWPVIRTEPATVAGIFTNWLCLLGLVPAISGFIGMSLVGFGGFGMTMRVPVLAGLAQMVVGYVLWLLTAYLLAMIVNALAPTFGGRQDFLRAFKVVAYGVTAAWLGGIFTIIPSLSILGLVAALYSIYLIYLGLPVLMDSPREKAIAYTAVVVVCGIVLGILIGVLSAALVPGGGFGGRMGAVDPTPEIAIKTPQGEITIDQRKMEEFAKRMEAASQKMEQASKGGDMAAVSKAAAEFAGAAANAAGGRTPLGAQDLKAMLPADLAGLQRESIEAQANEAAGIAMTNARAEYGSGERRISLAINDTGGLAGLAGIANWMNMTLDRETKDGVERVYRQGTRTVRERADKQARSAEYSLILQNGVMVEADGQGVDIATLKAAVEGLPLAKLEAAAR